MKLSFIYRTKKSLLVTFLLILLLNSMVSFTVDQAASWAVDSINSLKALSLLENEIFSDYGSYTTRADFAYLGVKLYEHYTGESAIAGDASFVDTSDEWVLKAKNMGIVNGYSDGSYKPAQLIKRDELAVLFVNVLKASGVEYEVYTGEKFADDSQIASWAKESVYIAKANGIISGVGQNLFDAKSNATIQQSLVMLNNAIVSERILENTVELVTPEKENPVSHNQYMDNINNCITLNIDLADYLGRDINIVLDEFVALYGENIKFIDFTTSYICILGDYGQVISLASTNGDIINKVTIGFNSYQGKPIDVSQRVETIKGIHVNQSPAALLNDLGLQISELDTARTINPSLEVIGKFIEMDGYTINVEFTSDMKQIFGLSVYTPFNLIGK